MAKKRRTKTAHPGVKLKKRQRANGTVWLARWRDPITQREKEVSLTALDLTTAEQRRTWAIKKSEEIVALRRSLGPTHRATKRWSIDDAVDDYLARCRTRLAAPSARNYANGLSRFQDWASTHGFRELEDLLPERLSLYREFLRSSPVRAAKKGGKIGERVESSELRSTSSTNSDLTKARIFLHDARRLGRLRLDSDAITDALRAVPKATSEPDPLQAPDIRRLLAACIAHDEARADVMAGIPAGPIVLFALLTGCRARELRELRTEYVDIESESIRLPSAATKTRASRTIGLDISPSIVTLIRSMAPPADGYVFGGAEPVSETVLRQLRQRLTEKFGAPEFTFQRLRATCVSFLVNSTVLPTIQSVRRTGHSLAVAEKHYLGIVRGIPREATTIEEAMGVGGLAVEVAQPG